MNLWEFCVFILTPGIHPGKTADWKISLKPHLPSRAFSSRFVMASAIRGHRPSGAWLMLLQKCPAESRSGLSFLPYPSGLFPITHARSLQVKYHHSSHLPSEPFVCAVGRTCSEKRLLWARLEWYHRMLNRLSLGYGQLQFQDLILQFGRHHQPLHWIQGQGSPCICALRRW